MAVELFIQHNSTIQFPVVKEGARLTLERKGTPGKLEFTVVKGPGLNFAEGDPVKLTVNGTAMFYGFVFKKKRDKGGTIDVVAYDQLRYLKNKDTITEEGLKASDLLKRIATDFRLNLGTVEDTGYTLETIVEENQTLFDMIQSALDETLMNTKQLYVLYDDAGKLTLKNINTMKLNLLIDEETGENFSYESSIDEQTYNKIKLAYNDEKTGKRELFIAQDGAKMNQWGVLQYFEEVQTKTGASAKADALLDLVTDICKRNGIKKLVWSTNKNDRVNHRNGCNMTVHRDFANKACPGEYLYSRHGEIAAEVNRRLQGASNGGGVVVTPPAAEKPTGGTTGATVTPYLVRVKITNLNIRKGPGTNYGATGYIQPGIYTIVAESTGKGAAKWGKLKSGAGWISLDYATKT